MQSAKQSTFKSVSFSKFLIFIIIIVSILLVSNSFYQNDYEPSLKFPSNPKLKSAQNLKTLRSFEARLLRQEERDQTLRNLRIDNDTFLIAITIGCIIVGVIGILLCVFCAIRKFGYQIHSSAEVSSNSCEIDIHKILPTISFSVFRCLVGKPLQNKCSICFESFEYETETKVCFKDDQLSEIVEENEDRIEDKDKEIRRLPPNVRLTMCGHIIHDECCSDLFNKNSPKKCPVCKESFEKEKLKEWETKIGVDFEKEYNEFFAKKEIVEKPNDQTHSSIVPEEESNPTCKKLMKTVNLNQNELYTISIYTKICQFHKSQETLLNSPEQKNAQEAIFHSSPKSPEKFPETNHTEEIKEEKKLDANKRYTQETVDSDKGYCLIVARRRSTRHSIESMASY